MKRNRALEIAGMTKHQYYHQSSGKRRGRKPSETTLFIEGNNVERRDNQEVVERLKSILADLDEDYGYRKATSALMIMGYIINHKKVYRLMDQHQLLKDQHKKCSRTRVRYRKVMPTAPLTVLEMDIKLAWVEEHRRFAYILSVIDTFTRVVLGWKAAYSIKQETVKSLWEALIELFLQPNDCLGRKLSIEVRNDNDSRFAAKSVQDFFQENSLNQVFTHPYTPQENGHVESFHSILSEKLSRYQFWSLDDLEQCLTLYYDKYNNHRLHGATLNLPPMIFWECWEQNEVETTIDEKKRTVKHKLLIPYHQIAPRMNRDKLVYAQEATMVQKQA